MICDISIRINCLQVPFKENVCKIVPVETCNPVTVTKCSNKTKNVRFQINAHRPFLDIHDKYCVSAGVARQTLTNICRSATMWPKTWSATFACWWPGTTADKWVFSLTALSFKNLNQYESYWWLHHSNEWWKCGFMSFWWTTLNNQVPTKVCNQEEVPLCTKQEVAETKKVDHYNDIQLKKVPMVVDYTLHRCARMSPQRFAKTSVRSVPPLPATIV